MSRVDWSDQAVWDSLYGDGGVDGYPGYVDAGGTHPLGTLNAWGQKNHLDAKVDAYLAQGIAPADKVLMAGSAYGHTIGILIREGIPFVVGLDSSPLIQGAPERDGTQVFVDDDIAQGGAIRARIRQAFGAHGFTGNNRDPDWIITESVLESYEDAEIVTILAGCEALCAGPNSQIIHVVMNSTGSPNLPDMVPPWPFNLKTMAEWKAFAPDHTWIDADRLTVG